MGNGIRFNIATLLLGICSTAVMAQEVVTRDSLSSDMPREYNPSTIDSSSNAASGSQPIVSDFHTSPTSLDNDNHEIDPHALDISVDTPKLPSWKNGMLVGGNSYYSTGFGMGYSAGIMAIQNMGRFTLSGNAGLTKDYMAGMGFLNGLNVGANLSYSVSDNVSLTGFGGMSHTGFMGPAPNLTNFYYGGYVTLMTNNQKWGMDLGVRRYYDATTGMWTTVPIAMPYYNWNGNKIGFDFGGLLLNTFHGLDKALNGDRYNPDSKLPGGGIIMPEIDTAPHFGSPGIPYIK